MKPIDALIQTLRGKLHLTITRSHREIEFAAPIPIAIKKSYEIDILNIEGVAVAVLSIDELQTKGIQKHLELFDKALSLPLLLNIKEGKSSLQKFLIDKHISFVIGNDTVYMPRFLVWIKNLSAKNDFRTTMTKKISKSAQMLIIHTLLSQEKRLDIPTVASRFDLSLMSASRILSELEERKLLTLSVSGRKKEYRLAEGIDPGELLKMMDCPKKGNLYIAKASLSHLKGALMTSYAALSRYSNLASTANEFALEKKKLPSSIETYDRGYDDDYVKIELWKYDPGIVQPEKNGAVDIFSLYLCLKADEEAQNDIRVQDAMEQLYGLIEEACNG